MENKFTKQIDALIQGEIQELVVEQPDFMAFREAWLLHTNRKNIVGEAILYGKIIYRFKKN